MEYRKCLLVLLFISAVRCDLCEDLDTFTNDSRCKAEYNDTFSVSALRIDNDVANVLIPNANPSCVSSNILSLGIGGVLQVKVYTKSVTVDDYLTVFVYDAEENNVIGQAKLLDGENRDSGEWSVYELILEGKLKYDGYIMVVGKASPNSEIMLKSICYSPPQQNSLTNSEFSYQNYQDIYALQTGSILKSRGTERVWIITADFWTPLTISLAVIIPTIILALLCWACFALGRRQGTKQQTQVYEDIDNLPKPYLVPRVKSVYAESITSSYGGRNNNIYSV